MKIHNIHFKNINSLAGEHQISFDQPPLADVGVFAITGPNGSGKTSILDAITLGLYGETYKFDRPARHVMTKHTADSFSEVVFSINKQYYRSSWHVSEGNKTDNGEQIVPEMQLMRIGSEEDILEDKSYTVRAKIAELTGMDFRRFTRSIILAQGDFAAFLNALDSERMDMLEKIISGDVYADYKKGIYQKAEEEQSKLENLKSELSEISLLDDVKKEAYELDLVEFKEQQDEYKDEKHTLQQSYSWLKNIDALEGRIAALTKKEQETNGLIEQKQEILAKIMANSEMLVFQDDINEIDLKQKQIKELQGVQAQSRNGLKHLESQLASLGGDVQAVAEPGLSIDEQNQNIETLKFQIGEIQLSQQSENELLMTIQNQQQEKEAQQRNIQFWMEEHRPDQSLIENFPDLAKLAELKVELAALKEKKENLEKWKKTTGSLLQKNQAGFEKIKKNIKQLQHKKQVLEKDLEKVLDGKDFSEINDLRAEQQDRVVQFRELLNLATEYQNLDSKSSGFFGSNEKKLAEVDELKDDFTHLTAAFVREQNIKSALDKAVFHEGWLLKHEKEREYLEPGQPCPLCGALQHPYAIQQPLKTDSKRALLDQTRKVKTLQGDLDKLQKQIRLAEQQSEILTEKENRKITIRSRWSTLRTKLNAVNDKLDLGNIRLMKKILREETDELQTIANLEKETRGLQLRSAKTDSLIEQQKLLLKQLQERNDQLDSDWKKRPQESKDLEEEFSRCELEEKTLSIKINEQLTSLGEKMSDMDNQEELITRLNSRKQDYQIHEQSFKDLQDELNQIVEKAKTCQSGIIDLNERLQRSRNQLRKEEINSLHLALAEKRKLIADEVSQTESKEAECFELQQKLLEKISTSDYKTLEALREIVTLLLSRSEVESTLTLLENEEQRLSTELKQEKAQLEAEKALKITEHSIEEIIAQQRSINEKLDISAQEIRHHEQILTQEKQRQQHYDQVNKQLLQQQTTYNESTVAIKNINENGGAFRLSVQQMMADRLLKTANHFLDKISGRYRLHKKESEHGLALEIEDTYQKNNRRLPKTLSGGESFVVSLSLALSLSEQANNGKSVDSLFLDEGFGNLDEEALYMVMSTLKSLKAHGKTVGVISHVKGVMDRIDTRIEMKKEKNGLSSFNFSY